MEDKGKTPYGSPPPPPDKNHNEVAAMYADNQLRMAKTVKDLHDRVKNNENCSVEHYKLANTYLYNIRLVMIFLAIVGGVCAFAGLLFTAIGSWLIGFVFFVPAIVLITKAIRLGLMKGELPGDYELVDD